VAGSPVIAQSYQRHGHQGFLRFLKVIGAAVPTVCPRSVTELEDDIRKWISEWIKNPSRSSRRSPPRHS
jgi:hypothetical protein